MNRHNKRWSATELQILRGSHGKISLSKLASSFGRTKAAVRAKMNEIGLNDPQDIMAVGEQPASTGSDKYLIFNRKDALSYYDTIDEVNDYMSDPFNGSEELVAVRKLGIVRTYHDD